MNPLKWLLDLIYPPKCVFCGKLLDTAQTDLCRACRAGLSETAASVRQGKHFETCLSLCYYENAVAESVRRYKFRGMSHYADAYGRLLAMMLLREHVVFDLVSWVPISAKRARERGYDQTRLLAEAVTKELGAPCVETLCKHRHNPAQSGMKSAKERHENVRDAYRAVDSERFCGKRVLLLDDVITTGATLNECSRVLRNAGAASVICATLAATRN